MKILKYFVSAIWLMAGCAPAEPPMVIMEPAISACNADELAHFVGLHRRGMDGVSFTVPVRWLTPGSMMTMDYSPDRINLELDTQGFITRVYCG